MRFAHAPTATTSTDSKRLNLHVPASPRQNHCFMVHAIRCFEPIISKCRTWVYSSAMSALRIPVWYAFFIYNEAGRIKRIASIVVDQICLARTITMSQLFRSPSLSLDQFTCNPLKYNMIPKVRRVPGIKNSISPSYMLHDKSPLCCQRSVQHLFLTLRLIPHSKFCSS